MRGVFFFFFGRSRERRATEIFVDWFTCVQLIFIEVTSYPREIRIMIPWRYLHHTWDGVFEITWDPTSIYGYYFYYYKLNKAERFNYAAVQRIRSQVSLPRQCCCWGFLFCLFSSSSFLPLRGCVRGIFFFFFFLNLPRERQPTEGIQSARISEPCALSVHGISCVKVLKYAIGDCACVCAGMVKDMTPSYVQHCIRSSCSSYVTSVKCFHDLR